MRVRARIRRFGTRFVADHRHNPVLRLAAQLGDLYRECYENLVYDPRFNGEAWLIHRVVESGPTRVFDVGANVGDWSAIVLEAHPGAELHCFEIVPATASALAERFAGRTNVTVNAFGLLDRAGTTEVKHYPEQADLSSVNDFPEPWAYEWVTSRVVTGDEYCEERGLEHIDLLKVDAEGADHRVLEGFRRMFEKEAIKAVQFEYGLASIQSHFLLYDHYRFFDELGYDVGKLFPTFVDFRPYDIRKDENFMGPNYVAVSRRHPDLRLRLARRP